MVSDSVAQTIKKVRTIATLQQVFGWILALFNGLVAFMGLVQIKSFKDFGFTFLFAVIAAAGVFLILKGRKKSYLIRLFYDYSARLSADPQKSIDLLAASTGVPVNEAVQNIKDMIHYGFMTNCFIDSQRNVLVTTHPTGTQSHSQQQVSGGHSTQPPIKYVMVKCKGCGATNKIAAGTVGECEYCGSKISE